jgi:hypothetical protein
MVVSQGRTKAIHFGVIVVEHPTQACPQFLERFSEFVDGLLPPDRRAWFQAHLDCCEGCLRHLAAYRNGVEALRSAPGVEIEPAEFWEQLQQRMWLERIESPHRRIAGRVAAYGALATAVVAFALIWVGTRIDLGFQRFAESARQPVVVMAGPSVGVPAAGDEDPASRALPSQGVRPPRPRPSTSTTRRAAETPDLDAAAQAMFEREVASIRERLEVDPWLGATSLEARPTFQPAGYREARYETVDILPAEPIPVSWSLRSSLTRP